jgi:hypothetical protein
MVRERQAGFKLVLSSVNVRRRRTQMTLSVSVGWTDSTNRTLPKRRATLHSAGCLEEMMT